MEAYMRETKRVVNRFLRHQLSFPKCIAALDAALARLTPNLSPENRDALRTAMLTNNETVMKEVERRAAATVTETRRAAKQMDQPRPI